MRDYGIAISEIITQADVRMEKTGPDPGIFFLAPATIPSKKNT